MGSTSLDAELLDSLHVAMRAGRGSGLTVAQRHSYPCVQLLAPFDGDKMPAAEKFLHVRCYDISPGGVAFFLPNPPDFEYAVLALGRAPFTFVIVRVVRHEPSRELGELQYLVGCRFMRRLDRNG